MLIPKQKIIKSKIHEQKKKKFDAIDIDSAKKKEKFNVTTHWKAPFEVKLIMLID